MEAIERQAPGRWSITGVALLLVVITASHYLTSPSSVAWHNVYRRLYYLPIVWAAFAGGWRYGLLAAAIATAAYLPHAFFMHHHLDPAPGVDKAFEMILYFGVGGLAGALVDRERQARARQQREALARAAAEARANRLVSLVHLTRGLAHEIRNPLGGIQGAIEILAEEVAPDSPRREMVEVGLSETARLNRVLDEFLQFARPREPRMEAFQPGDTVRQVVELQRSCAEADGIRLEAEVGSGDRQVIGDAEQVAQVLLNLVLNSLRATPRGGRITVRTSIRQSVDMPASVRIEVLDDGEGVPVELGESIYDPYVSGREGGSGLGLAVSALLVQQHGSVLAHRARPEGGTVFGFDLDLAGGGMS